MPEVIRYKPYLFHVNRLNMLEILVYCRFDLTPNDENVGSKGLVGSVGLLFDFQQNEWYETENSYGNRCAQSSIISYFAPPTR